MSEAYAAGDGGLRHRKARIDDGDDKEEKSSPDNSGEYVYENTGNTKRCISLESGSYWLTRIVIIRYLGFIYFVAFLVALHQNQALLGKDGLLPAQLHLKHIKTHLPSSMIDRVINTPTVLWLFNYEDNLDTLLDGIAIAGVLLSIIPMLFGSANMLLMFTLWMLYHSIVNVGQRWYSFGWESQLLETGFLGIFLCPLFSLSRLPRNAPPSSVVIWGLRWLIFRIMLGAGLIKIRGDSCWHDLTCMNYHYETQPVPNPMSYFMHQTPEIFHKFETLSNHFIELVVPFLLLLTRRCRMIGGFLQILFQVVLIISGNLSFLNWLTIVPSLACFDDKAFAWFFSSQPGFIDRVKKIQIREEQGHFSRKVRRAYQALYILLGMSLAYLSWPIVKNLLSKGQIMNTSYDPFRIVNTYGAFGSVTKERTEVIFQGTYSDNPNDPNAEWFEYQFKCKPGDVYRRPCVISPYHYRLDWLMWFAAFQQYQYNPWLVHMAYKFLENNDLTEGLIAYNPFQGKDPPKWVRAEHFRYKFTKIGSTEAASGAWWIRERIGNYLPAVNSENLRGSLKQMGWI